MRLATEDTLIGIGSASVRLRPSLRAAFRLDKRHGIDGVFAGLIEGSLTVTLDVIAECRVAGTGDIVAALDPRSTGLGVILEKIAPVLIDVVCDLAGFDPDEDRGAEAEAPQAKPKPFREHLVELYRIGTGALGWSPAETYAATPAEILEAYRGRCDLLRAMFGGKPKDTRTVEEKARSIFAGRTVKVERPA